MGGPKKKLPANIPSFDEFSNRGLAQKAYVTSISKPSDFKLARQYGFSTAEITAIRKAEKWQEQRDAYDRSQTVLGLKEIGFKTPLDGYWAVFEAATAALKQNRLEMRNNPPVTLRIQLGREAAIHLGNLKDACYKLGITKNLADLMAAVEAGESLGLNTVDSDGKPVEIETQ